MDKTFYKVVSNYAVDIDHQDVRDPPDLHSAQDHGEATVHYVVGEWAQPAAGRLYIYARRWDALGGMITFRHEVWACAAEDPTPLARASNSRATLAEVEAFWKHPITGFPVPKAWTASRVKLLYRVVPPPEVPHE